MTDQILILDIFYYFVATTICVPFFKMLGLGSIIGYLVAGVILGPSGMRLLHHAENIQEISQIGVILLMFVIGLELSPARLKHMQKLIWGPGIVQFFGTTLILFGISSFMGIDPWVALFISCGLSMSSTAFALSYLKDTEQLTKSYGQASFGVLIFQDIIIIPLLAIVPLLTLSNGATETLEMSLIVQNIAIVCGTILFGKFALRPALNFIHETQTKEIFIGTSLMIVLGAALLMGEAGLSKALGAFVAGILLSDSKFRTEIQNFSVTLKSMLMGVFFMGIGLSLDLSFFRQNLSSIAAITTTFMGVKFAVLFFMGKVIHKSWSSGFKMAAILCQAGEFSLLIVSTLAISGLMSSNETQIIMSSIIFSIFIAPIVTKVGEMVNSTPFSMLEDESNVIAFPTPVDDVVESDDERKSA